MTGSLRLLTGMEGRAETEGSEIKVYLSGETEEVDGTEVVYQPVYGFSSEDLSQEELRNRDLEEVTAEYETLAREYGHEFPHLVEQDPEYMEINVWGEHAAQYTDDKASFYPFSEGEQREVRPLVE